MKWKLKLPLMFKGITDKVIEKVWYSTQYGVSLKEENFDEEGKLIRTLEVTKIEKDGDYSDKFIPEKEVNWKE